MQKTCKTCGCQYSPGKGCPGCAVNRSRKWRNANPERARALARKNARIRRIAHPEMAAEHSRKRYEKIRRWRAANPDRVAEYNRRYSAKTEYAAQKAWTDRNPNYQRVAKVNRRSVEKCSPAELKKIHALVNRIKSRKTARCFYCGIRAASSQIEFDHIVPLSKGGRHAADNLCVACQTCNRMKSAKALIDWAKQLKQPILNLI